jgi:hypothetical protein
MTRSAAIGGTIADNPGCSASSSITLGSKPDAEGAEFKTEGFQGSVDFAVDRDALRERRPTIVQQQAALLALRRLEVRRSEPPDPHGSGDRPCMLTIGF